MRARIIQVGENKGRDMGQGFFGVGIWAKDSSGLRSGLLKLFFIHKLWRVEEEALT